MPDSTGETEMTNREQIRETASQLMEAGLSEDEATLIAKRRLRSSETAMRSGELPLMIFLALLAAIAVRIIFFTGMAEHSSDVIRWVVPSALLPAVLYLCYALQVSKKETLFLSLLFILLPLLSSFYPSIEPHHTAFLAAGHLPVVLMYIMIRMLEPYLEKDGSKIMKRKKAVEFAGETAIFSVLMMLGWVVMCALFFQASSLMGIDLDENTETWLIPSGFAALVTVATFVVLKGREGERRITSFLSSVFTPLFDVLLLLFILFMIFTSGIESDMRELLILMDGILILVVLLILFSSDQKKRTLPYHALSLLIACAIALDIIALIYMSGRLISSGITPNKSAGFVLNLLILIHLLIIAPHRFRSSSEEGMEQAKTGFLFIYAIWAFQVVFFFPLLFQFK